MSDKIKTSEGRVVGTWNGDSARELKLELTRIKQRLAAEKSSEKLVTRDMPHRGQIPGDLRAFNAYPLWGCDKSGQCLVGAGANRIESVQKVLAYSLVEHHSGPLSGDGPGVPAASKEVTVFKHILIATDGSEQSNKGVTQGFVLAEKICANVTILTVVQPLSVKAMRSALSGGIEDPIGRHDKQIDEEMHIRYAAFEKEAALYNLTVNMMHEFDDVPAEAIVREAELLHCDLIIMASHSRRGVSRRLLGSQTSQVLAHTHIPVLVMR